MSNPAPFEFDVAIVGAGPAGLSAAITLGRACRRVVVFDHAKPRNYAAEAIHCYLGREGLSPWVLREQGRNEASAYGVKFVDAEVTTGRCLTKAGSQRTAFAIVTADRELRVRSILLATGVMDRLPEISGLRDFYGVSVHHCPYCDGWEHRDQSLVALGSAEDAVKLAATLLGWSHQVTACTNGESIAEMDRLGLEELGIRYREEKIRELRGEQRVVQGLIFADGTSLACEAIFFSSSQCQRSSLPELLGCNCDEEGLVVTQKKQCTSITGVYLAGDADGDVQFAIVAAAEGAIAATAIHQALLNQDQVG